MQPSPIGFRRSPLALASITLSLLLSACGGGSETSASTSTGTLNSSLASSVQLASGTVTGFGSIYVDGVKLEDATAPVTRENWDGSFSNMALKLGQRVRVAHDGFGMASSVNVDAAVIGSVSAVDTSTSTMTVAGQIVKVNTDSTSSLPVTVFGGINAAGVTCTSLSNVAANDLVQVYGSAVYNSSTKVYELQATRIEAQIAGTAPSVMGTVAGIDTTAKTFRINGLLVDYSAAILVSSTSTLANDLSVVVWGKPGSLSSVNGTPTLTAARVRLTRANTTGTTTVVGKTQISGLVSKYDATAKSLVIDGVTINVATATITPTTSTLADNNFVDIKGSFGTDGVVLATDVRIRQQSTIIDTARINLGGVISSFVDSTSYVVRGVPVDASAATIGASCTGVTLADGVYVNVEAKAQLDTAVVLASTVNCLPTLPTFAMRELLGTVSRVEQTAKTLTLTGAGSTTQTQLVLWSDQTVFTGLTAADLTTTTTAVRVAGYLNSSNVLVAREIRLNGQADQDVFTPPSVGNVQVGWGRYKMQHGH